MSRDGLSNFRTDAHNALDRELRIATNMIFVRSAMEAVADNLNNKTCYTHTLLQTAAGAHDLGADKVRSCFREP
jgi:hypothetical protein